MMGLTLVDIDGPGAIELICDGCGSERARFTSRRWIADALSAASAAGWKETFDARGRQLRLGPCCSGKKATA
jgi:hypothetical protein